MIRLFTGFDPREAVGFHVFMDSLLLNARELVSVTPLCGNQRDGTNAFTYERFSIPRLCNYEGWALFVDGCDMLLRADLGELWGLRDDRYAVQVVKHNYLTKHHMKYIGTEMEAANEDYPRKNWSSVVLWNCSENRGIDETQSGAYLHSFAWLEDSQIGEISVEWNWLADEYGPNDSAKLLHWTAGIPGFPYYHNVPHADEWRKLQMAKYDLRAY